MCQFPVMFICMNDHEIFYIIIVLTCVAEIYTATEGFMQLYPYIFYFPVNGGCKIKETNNG